MVSVVSENLDKITALCRQMQVESLYLFGSAVHESAFTPDSDLDFLLLYKKDKEGLPQSPFDYFDLLFSLEEITGRKVDLVIADNIRNSFFLEQVEKEKLRIYEA
jgi:predicted nucleotidyltransferase